MSHFSTLRTKVSDAEILKNSLRDLGITTNTEADVRGYNGQSIRADIVAVLEGEAASQPCPARPGEDWWPCGRRPARRSDQAVPDSG